SATTDRLRSSLGAHADDAQGSESRALDSSKFRDGPRAQVDSTRDAFEVDRLQLHDREDPIHRSLSTSPVKCPIRELCSPSWRALTTGFKKEPAASRCPITPIITQS